MSLQIHDMFERKYILFQGQYKFKCPAYKDGTSVKCDAVWPYQEVRRLAVLTPEEMEYFEENIARMAATEYCEIKTVSFQIPSKR